MKSKHLVNNWRKIAITFFVLFLFVFMLWIIDDSKIRAENTQLKENCNITKEEVREIDYHSSWKLFCENYNGVQELYLGLYESCAFIKNDIRYNCIIRRDVFSGKYLWEEECEVIK